MLPDLLVLSRSKDSRLLELKKLRYGTQCRLSLLVVAEILRIMQFYFVICSSASDSMPMFVWEQTGKAAMPGCSRDKSWDQKTV